MSINQNLSNDEIIKKQDFKEDILKDENNKENNKEENLAEIIEDTNEEDEEDEEEEAEGKDKKKIFNLSFYIKRKFNIINFACLIVFICLYTKSVIDFRDIDSYVVLKPYLNKMLNHFEGVKVRIDKLSLYYI